MSTHKALVRWQFGGGDQAKGHYSREHHWTFDGGATILASPSPAVVPAPWSNSAAVDPEEAFVASLSSCHMLTFLHLASRAGLQPLSYQDEASGTLTKNDAGERWVSAVVLRPRVSYAASHGPSEGQEAQLHRAAHAQCFIANSVKTEISIDLEVPA